MRTGKCRVRMGTYGVQTGKPCRLQYPEPQIVFGVAHIYASFNDTFVHVTDLSGRETIMRVTGGMKVKAGSLRASECRGWWSEAARASCGIKIGKSAACWQLLREADRDESSPYAAMLAAQDRGPDLITKNGRRELLHCTSRSVSVNRLLSRHKT